MKTPYTTELTSLSRLEELVLSCTFYFVRLIDEKGSVIISSKALKKNDYDLARKHWRHITETIDIDLPPGTYFIECAYDSSNKNGQRYKFVKPKDYVPEPRPLDPPAPTEKQKTIKQMTEKEIYDMIRQNGELTVQNEFLTQQNKALSDRVAALESELEGLDDEPELSDTERIANIFSEIMPKALPALDRFFDLKERELNLKYGNGAANPPRPVAKKIPVQNSANNTSKDEYQTYLTMLNNLFDTGQDEKANEILEQVKQADINVYNQLCSDLDLEDVNDENA